MYKSPAQRLYDRRVLLLSAGYAIALLGAVYAFRHHLVGGAAAYGVALLPALPIVGVFAAVGRYLGEERDEYLRMLMVRQALVASGFALTVTTVWGFLESFDLVGHVEAYYVSVLWFGGLGLGGCINAFDRGGAREAA